MIGAESLFPAFFTVNLNRVIFNTAILLLHRGCGKRLMVRHLVRFGAMASAVVLLSACATVIEKPTQDLKIEILGTGEALCDVTQSGRRYRAYAPSTIKIRKSHDLLNVRCFAPGNREKTVVLESKVTNSVLANVANGVLPGMTWDVASGAAFRYPDTVVVDFTDMPPQPYPLPDYQAVLNANPVLIGLEEFRPGRSALISDMGTGVQTMQKRPDDVLMEETTIITTPAPAKAENTTVYSKVPDEDK
jgi:hypothetical protein